MQIIDKLEKDLNLEFVTKVRQRLRGPTAGRAAQPHPTLGSQELHEGILNAQLRSFHRKLSDVDFAHVTIKPRYAGRSQQDLNEDG
jgi:hypothetical protein